MNWSNITKDEKVKQLLIDRFVIEQEIARLDDKALINYELEILSAEVCVLPNFNKDGMCFKCGEAIAVHNKSTKNA